MKELFRLSPNNATGREWFEALRWPEGIRCTDCGSYCISEVNHKTMPHRCQECRHYFSALTGTAMQGSKIGLQDWAIAIYMVAPHLKGVSSMYLHRELGVTQRTAWYMLQRIREAFAGDPGQLLAGTVEIDEMFVGGRQSNRHRRNRERYTAEDHYGKKPVAAAVERGGKVVAKPIHSTYANTLTRFVEANVKHGSSVITGRPRRLHGPHGVLPAPHGQALRRRVCQERRCPYQHRGVPLDHVQARLRRHLPPHVLSSACTAASTSSEAGRTSPNLTP